MSPGPVNLNKSEDSRATHTATNRLVEGITALWLSSDFGNVTLSNQISAASLATLMLFKSADTFEHILPFLDVREETINFYLKNPAAFDDIKAPGQVRLHLTPPCWKKCVQLSCYWLESVSD